MSLVCIIVAIICFVLAALAVVFEIPEPKLWPASAAIGLAFFAGASLPWGSWAGRP